MHTRRDLIKNVQGGPYEYAAASATDVYGFFSLVKSSMDRLYWVDPGSSSVWIRMLTKDVVGQKEGSGYQIQLGS